MVDEAGGDASRADRLDKFATGPDAVAFAFANQVGYCRANDAPVTAAICAAVGALVPGSAGGAVMRRVRKWAGPPLADALPLRVAAGLHALRLRGEEPALDPIYEDQRLTGPEAIVAEVLDRHEAFVLPWLDRPPQTNEAGRAAPLAAGLLWLAARGLPGDVALYEMGASAGINLMMRRFRFDLGGVAMGPPAAGIAIAPEWRGAPPPGAAIDIVHAEGCDLAPVDLTDPDAALRLRAYIWPEARARIARLDAAIAAAQRFPPEVHRERATAFIARVLATPAPPGVTRVIWHSVVWQYLADAEQAEIADRIATAGQAATPDAPLAWLALEANRDTYRHELTVRQWPGGGGGEPQRLAEAHPHGAWVQWLA